MGAKLYNPTKKQETEKCNIYSFDKLRFICFIYGGYPSFNSIFLFFSLSDHLVLERKAEYAAVFT
jgi:hypothetical protein